MIHCILLELISARVSTAHPLDTIICHALKLDCETLVATVQKNKENGHITYIHTSCRNFLRNHARSKKRPTSSTEQLSSKRVSIRSDQQSFDFKKQCFYCGYERHPNRYKFEEVRTKSSGIYYVTLALCQSRDDEFSKTVEAQLLSAHDLVAAEARYHVAYHAEQGLKILLSIQHLVVQHPLKKWHCLMLRVKKWKMIWTCTPLQSFIPWCRNLGMMYIHWRRPK